MFSVKSCPIPDNVYLARYQEQSRSYTDCFSVDISRRVSLSEFISVFFNTFLFRMERRVLSVFSSSTHQDVVDLATGSSDSLALWSVEARDDDQLLLSFGKGDVHTWLMVLPGVDGADSSRLYFGTGLHFGSTIIPEYKAGEGARLSTVYYPFIGCHRIYARLLL